MSYLQNLHTHTTFCDGKDTPREMLDYAVDKGFDSLGFSSHSYMQFTDCGNVTPTSTERYIKEINILKKEYKDKIKVFLGLEADMFSTDKLSGFDYLIGSVHALKIGEEYLDFDVRAAQFKEIVDNYFDSDGMKIAKKYYETISELYLYGNFDIIGHFDIIAKHFETMPIFDVKSKEYLNLAFDAIHALKGKIPLFEVNTGAVSRGYRSNPYPTIEIIKEFRNAGFGVVITSDCHDKTKLDAGFSEAEQLLKSCGYKEKYILSESGFKAISL